LTTDRLHAGHADDVFGTLISSFDRWHARKDLLEPAQLSPSAKTLPRGRRYVSTNWPADQCQLVIEQVADAIIVADREGCVRVWNAGAQRQNASCAGGSRSRRRGSKPYRPEADAAKRGGMNSCNVTRGADPTPVRATKSTGAPRASARATRYASAEGSLPDREGDSSCATSAGSSITLFRP